MSYIPLNAEQCANLPFPPGCPVWWYHPQKQQQSAEEKGDGNNDSLSMTTTTRMKRGVIKSAALYNNGAQLFYQVEYNNNDSNDNTTTSSTLIIEEVADTHLSFGASCPVTIVSNSNDNNSSEEKEELLGEIVMSEPSSSSDSNKIVYTAMIFINDDGSSSSSSSRVRYESGIDAERIKYRKVDENANNNSSTNNSKGDDDDANAISTSTKDTNCKKKSSNDAPAAMPTTIQQQQQPPPVVPASITCSDSAPSKRGAVALSQVAPSSSNDSMAADSSSSRKRAKYSNNTNMNAPNDGAVGSNLNVPRLEITVPLWLQRDRKSQRDLFFHLLGGGQNMNRINRESRCRVNIKMNNDTFEPLTIYVDTPQSNAAPKDLKIARRMIQELFLEYLGDDGARGRLVYEIASSCSGAHRPNCSTSNAVREVNPLVEDLVERYMSIVELSYELTTPNGEKSFHAAHILHKPFLAEIAGLGCDLILVADGFRIPTRLCDPYVLVYGKTFRDVDRAVDMVKHKISQHQQVCGKCTMLS